MRLTLALFGALILLAILPATAQTAAVPATCSGMWAINPPGTSGLITLTCVPTPQASAADTAAQAGIAGPLWADGHGNIRAVHLGPGIVVSYTANGPYLDVAVPALAPVPCTASATTLMVQVQGGCLPLVMVGPSGIASAATPDAVLERSAIGGYFPATP